MIFEPQQKIDIKQNGKENKNYIYICAYILKKKKFRETVSVPYSLEFHSLAR